MSRTRASSSPASWFGPLGRWLFGLAVIVLVSLAPSTTALAAVGRVRIAKPLAADPLLDEAVARTLGELVALGLDVEVLQRSTSRGGESGPLEPGTHGLIEFARSAQGIRVDTWGPQGGRALSLDFAHGDSRWTAEVIAIRAVEALRARWLLQAESEAHALPPAVAELARRSGSEPPATSPIARATPDPTPAATSPAQPPPVEITPSEPAPIETVREPPSFASPSTLSRDWSSQLRVGSSLMLESRGRSPWLLDASVLIRITRQAQPSLSVGFNAALPLTSLSLVDDSGSVEVRRTRGAAVLCAELPLSKWVSPFAQLGLGASHFEVDASAAPGLLARDATRISFEATLRAGVHLWLLDALGSYAAFEASALDRELTLRVVDQVIARLGRPTFAAQLGLGLRLP